MDEIMAVFIRMLLYPRIAIELNNFSLVIETRLHHCRQAIAKLDKYCFEETRANPESCPNNIVWTAICKYMEELVK